MPEVFKVMYFLAFCTILPSFWSKNEWIAINTAPPDHHRRPKTTQDDPKTSQRPPKTPQDGPKTPTPPKMISFGEKRIEKERNRQNKIEKERKRKKNRTR